MTSHGGKRKGAGRPRDPNAVRRKYRSVPARLRPDEYTAFAELCARRGTTMYAEIQRMVRKELEDEQ